MFRKMCLTIAAMTMLAVAAFGAEGAVSRVDTDAQTIAVKVAEREYIARVGDVDLVGKDGKPIMLHDFKVGAKVEVTLKDGKVAKIQLLGE